MESNYNNGFLSDVDIKESIKNNEIVIHPFNDKKLTPLGYNLSFTKFIFSTKNRLLYDIKTDPKTNDLYCMIEPNDTVLILTLEAVWVSRQYAGTFHSKVGIVSKGFGHISTTLDPNWEGPLLISLNNPTARKIKLVIGKDENDGIKYNTFVTLILYKMISPAEGVQDNLPGRIEILKMEKDKLKEKKKYKDLIEVIDQIRNFSLIQVQIGKSKDEERVEKIKLFKEKYSLFMITLNSNIHTAAQISKSIVRINTIKYYAGILLGMILLMIQIYVIFKAYKKPDINFMTFMSVVTATYVAICLRIEEYWRKILL